MEEPDVLSITIDRNCIIGLEENRDYAVYIKKLIELNCVGDIELCIPGMSASERNPDGSYSDRFQNFESKLLELGLQDAELLKPIAYWDISYWDEAV